MTTMKCKVFKRNTLITSITMVLLGFITIRVGDIFFTTISESGMVQDSRLMLIGTILIFLGLMPLLVAIGWYLFDFIKRSIEKKTKKRLRYRGLTP